MSDHNNSVSHELINVANVVRRVSFRGDHSKRSDPSQPTNTQHWFLSYIYNNRDEHVLQKDLEFVFSIRRSTASEILKAMEQKGLIVRTKLMDDGRAKKLTLTPKGAEIAEDNNRKLLMTESFIIDSLDDAERKILLALLSKVRSKLEAFEESYLP